ncbi:MULTISPECIES: Rieske (2Fe-2S) protein [Halorussus]|uniref:Rieske (2Fe-2S) protein n=1 Tax=Halorussus TaxID=1070314 RepID=UPI000E2197CB|nr:MULTISPECIES: Rieske (2Fe-2S) protein [Halorussus]NHN58492.1 Rieske (2Fe-2S) protein [Halorussus sp. JP-T4]
MADGARLTATETVYESGSWLFTVRDRYDELDEVILVPCEDDGDELETDGARTDGGATTEDGGSSADRGVEAWVNRCTHEAQRLDRGFGAAMRDGQVICPKHGSMFDACSGYCDNGEAADTTLVSVEVAVEDGAVYLTDDGYDYVHEGSIEDGEDEESDEGTDETGGSDDEDDGGDDDDMPSSTSHIGF